MWLCTSVGAHIDMQSIKEVPTTTAAISVYQQFSNKGNLQNCSPVYYFQGFFLWLRHQSAMVHTPSRIDLANENVFVKSFLLSLKTKLDSNRCNAKIQNLLANLWTYDGLYLVFGYKNILLYLDLKFNTKLKFFWQYCLAGLLLAALYIFPSPFQSNSSDTRPGNKSLSEITEQKDSILLKKEKRTDIFFVCRCAGELLLQETLKYTQLQPKKWYRKLHCNQQIH